MYTIYFSSAIRSAVINRGYVSVVTHTTHDAFPTWVGRCIPILPLAHGLLALLRYDGGGGQVMGWRTGRSMLLSRLQL